MNGGSGQWKRLYALARMGHALDDDDVGCMLLEIGNKIIKVHLHKAGII